MDLLLFVTILMAVLLVISVIIAVLQYRKAQTIITYFPTIKIIKNFPESDKEAKEKIESGGYSVIREDLVQKESYILSPVGHYKKTIGELIPYLDKRDVDIIIVCSAICRAEDENQHNLAAQLHVSLVDRYITRGKYTYNRLKSGVFQSTILPYLNELKQILGNDKIRIARLFQDYYDSVINFVADRIWIGEKDHPEYLKSQIQNRFNRFSNLKILWIHSRKSYQVTIARMGCKMFKEENHGFEIKELPEKTIRGKISITLQVIKK